MSEQQPNVFGSFLTGSVRIHRSRYNVPCLLVALSVTGGCIGTLLAILLVEPSPVPSRRHRVVAFLPFSVVVFVCWWLLWSFRSPVVGADEDEGRLPTHEPKRGSWGRQRPHEVTLPAAVAGRHGRGRDSAGPRLVIPSVRSRSGSGSTDATIVAPLSRETTRSAREHQVGLAVVGSLKRGNSTASRNTAGSAKERLEVNTGGLSRTMSTRSNAPSLPPLPLPGTA